MTKEIILLKGATDTNRTYCIEEVFNRINSKYKISNFKENEELRERIQVSFKIENKTIAISNTNRDLNKNFELFKECEICLLKCFRRGENLTDIYKWAGENSFGIILVDNEKKSKEEVIESIMGKLKNIL